MSAAIDLGIRSEKLLTFVTPLFRYRDFDQRVAFVNAELETVRAIPGVVSVAAISRIPLTEIAQTTRYAFPGQPVNDTRAQDALSRVVSREYFSTVGARPVRVRRLRAGPRRDIQSFGRSR